MELNQYQEQAVSTAEYGELYKKTDKYPVDPDVSYIYPALGLAGESGEVVEKIKKIVRNMDGVFGDTEREGIKNELGDVLWYIAVLAHEFQLSLSDIAEHNVKKLASRQARGVIKSSGDNR